MSNLIKWALIILAVIVVGRWAVEGFMAFVDARYAEREEMARQVGEKKGAEMTRRIEAGQAVRAEELRRQVEQAGPGTVGGSPINTAPLRRELEAAQQGQQRELPNP